MGCVDPSPPETSDEGGGGGGQQDGHIGEWDIRFLLEMKNLRRTPFDDEFFEWLFGDNPGGGDDPGGDDPGGDNGGDQGGDEPYDPGYIGASYEGESTADPSPPACGPLWVQLMEHPIKTIRLQSDRLVATLAPMPDLRVTYLDLPQPVPLPWYVKLRFGLTGKWALAAGTHLAAAGRLSLPLVRLR